MSTKNSFENFLNDITVFCFWGSAFLLILIFGFNIELSLIIKEAFSLRDSLSGLGFYCALLLLLSICFPILIFIDGVTSSVSFTESLLIFFPTVFWSPWRGLLFHYIKSNGLWFWLRDVFKMIAWWLLFLGGVFVITRNKNNTLFQIITSYDSHILLIRFGLCFLALLIFYVIVHILFNAMTKKWRDL